MIKVIQRVGDRDKVAYSIKDIAFTVPANPMSDRVQMIIEIYDDKVQTAKAKDGDGMGGVSL